MEKPTAQTELALAYASLKEECEQIRKRFHEQLDAYEAIRTKLWEKSKKINYLEDKIFHLEEMLKAYE